ncbi:DUF4012 domain-containing protein [uncultured Methanobrevibacter sp.]|uniref:DUF4012 domain-containing protein n=1 Tax=uncultured Methanobrevibacter sp. TaxID=253161 RepID=UPI0025EBBFA6|nr:DUF4012 domain-containing protein [uncultured Methanobrevibacter sp.]
MGLLVNYAGILFFDTDNYHGDMAEGDKDVLLCIIDESEPRLGMGACDMVFIIHLENGTFKNYSPVYPSGMVDPNKQEPIEAQNKGAGSSLLLHDAFWYDDDQSSMGNAKEIVEYNCNVSIDGVIAINAEALSAILKEAGPVTVGNKTFTPNSFDIIGDPYSGGNANVSMMDIVREVINNAKDPSVKSAMVQEAFSQYSQGNIVMTPKGAFTTFLYMRGLETMN